MVKNPNSDSAGFLNITNPELKKNIFSNTTLVANYAEFGGALYFDTIEIRTPIFQDCLLRYNSASQFGGAIYFTEYPINYQVCNVPTASKLMKTGDTHGKWKIRAQVGSNFLFLLILN